MKIALVADAFPPLRSSAAVQLRDLSLEFVKQGHEVVVIIPSSDIKTVFSYEKLSGVDVLRIKAPRTKDVGFFRRTVAEFFLPCIMLCGLQFTRHSSVRWSGIVWYSPSIFLGLLASVLKKFSACRSYLILRDVFPEWAADMGLMGRGLPYKFFKAVANYQYSVADVIGVQTQGNKAYFDDRPNSRIEVLQNWLADAPNVGCSINVAGGKLAGRTVFVYAGNMGVAQGMGVLLDLAERLIGRNDIGFLFVGRGSDAQRMRINVNKRGLDNVAFHDEIDPTEIPGLYAQCHIGIVALDPRHKTHNIPGKFLSYMQAGLPVLASINPGNDLAQIIRDERVGQVCESNQVGDLLQVTNYLLAQIESDGQISSRCRNLFQREFAVDKTVCQIVSALSL
jgi:glycosyltransferase involved in cell wall biosynthesis